jgi:RimJ/RimL family protein N-acetyltransferase
MKNEIQKIEIRPYELHEAQALYDAVRESITDLSAWLPWCHQEYSIGESKEWISVQIQKWQEQEEFSFGIFDDCGRLLGGCGLNQIDWQNKSANLGYWVRSLAMGQGVALRAVKLLAAWSFKNTDLTTLEIKCALENIRSQRVAQKLKALDIGTRRKCIDMNGKKLDARVFVIEKEES